MFDAADRARALAAIGPLHQLPRQVERIQWASPHGCRSTIYSEHAVRVTLAQSAVRQGRASVPLARLVPTR